MANYSDATPVFDEDGNVYIGTYTTQVKDSDTDSETDGFLKGDINGDGIVDIIDVALARAHIVGNIVLDAEQLKRGDMNGDNTLDIIDVVMIRKTIVEKE